MVEIHWKVFQQSLHEICQKAGQRAPVFSHNLIYFYDIINFSDSDGDGKIDIVKSNGKIKSEWF